MHTSPEVISLNNDLSSFISCRQSYNFHEYHQEQAELTLFPPSNLSSFQKTESIKPYYMIERFRN
jgi:hypothetical protein